MKRRYTESGVLHRAAQNLNLDDALTDAVGGGWEHVLHEVLHYVVCQGVAPVRQDFYDTGEFSRKVNEVIEATFPEAPARDKHEIIVAGLEKTLARRFGVRVDPEMLSEAVQANVSKDWTVKDVRKAMRKVHAKRGRYGKAVNIAEDFIRGVAG